MSSLQSFLHMGGYAIYVWPAYFLTLVVLVYNVVSTIRRESRFFRMLAESKKRQRRSR